MLTAKHYLSPFVAHALPSLIGGAIAALLAASRKLTFALVVGGLHLLGGIAAAIMIPARLVHRARPDRSLPAHGLDRRTIGSASLTRSP